MNITFKTDKGLTLAEILIAVSVAVILATLLFSAGRRIVRNADNSKCINNLRQLAVAINASAADRGYYINPRREEKELGWKKEMLHYIPDKRVFFCPSFVKVDSLRGIMDDSGPASWWQYGSPGYSLWMYPINDNYMPDDTRNLKFGQVDRTGFTWWDIDKPSANAAPKYPAPDDGSKVLVSDIFYGPTSGNFPWTTYHPDEGKREHGIAGVNAAFVDGHVEWIIINKHLPYE